MRLGPILRSLSVPALLLGLTATAGAQTTHPVTAGGFSFSPVNVSIVIGDSVRWINGGGDHTVTEGLGPVPVGGEAFNTVLIPSAPIFQQKFGGKFLIQNPRPGNVYPYYCVPHFVFNMKGTVSVSSPWLSVGPGLAGGGGVPLLYGDGTLAAGSSATITLENAAANALVGLFLSFASTPVPFKGGTLCTVPIASTTIFPIGPTGSVALSDTIAPGIPAGTQVYWQYAVQDGTAPVGVALSNCLRSTFP